MSITVSKIKIKLSWLLIVDTLLYESLLSSATYHFFLGIGGRRHISFPIWKLKLENMKQLAGLKDSNLVRGLQCPQVPPFNLKSFLSKVSLVETITHIYKKRPNKEWQGALVPSQKIEYKETMPFFFLETKKETKERKARQGRSSQWN